MIITALEKLEKEMAELKLRIKELELIEKENVYLRELVHHLASRPTPYQPVIVPAVQTPNYPEPPWKVTC
jgi:hypothetical protein